MPDPTKTKAKSYDDNFLTNLDKEYNIQFNKSFNNNLVLNNAFYQEVHQVDFDTSNQDYLNKNINPFLDQHVDLYSNDPFNEIRANNQPWIDKFGTGFARATVKAGAEILKIPGIAIGILDGVVGQVGDLKSGEDNTDFMSVAFDNAWVRAINDGNEWINNEALPVYVKKAVSEGSIWKNLTSIDFWTTDGADGLGYIAAMLAPGALLSKAGLGTKLMGGLGKLDDVGAAVDKMGKLAKLGLPTNARNVDLYAQTIANTVLEAGAEAQQAGKQYEDELLAKLKSGKIDQAQFDLDIENKSKIMANIFGANAAILIGPNAIMSKMLWGGARNATRKTLFNKVTGKIEGEANPSVLKRISNVGNEFAKAGSREGLWEEGMQSTASNYFSDLSDDRGTFAGAYMDMIGTTEGQKAIALGAMFGGGMQAYTGNKQSKAETDVSNKLISYANDKLDTFWKDFEGDIYAKDEEGNKIPNEEGNGYKYDNIVLQERLQNLNSVEALSAMHDMAMNEGNVEQVKQLRNQALTSLIIPFLKNESLGTNTLRQYLENNPGIKEMAKNEGVKPESIIQDIMDKAIYLEQSLKNFEDFSQPLINVKNVNASKEQTQKFYEGLKDNYFNIRANKQFIDSELKSLNTKLQSIIEEKGRTIEEYKDNGKLARDLENGDLRLKNTAEKIKNYNKAKEEIDKKENEFWNKDINQKNFDKSIKHSNKLIKEKAERAEEITEIINKINNATDISELDDINKTNTFADDQITEAIVKRKAELEQVKEAKKEETITKQKEQSKENKKTNAKKQAEKEDLGSFISSFNPGESIPLTKSQLQEFSDEIKNSNTSEYEGNIESETDDSITINIQETGERLTIPKKINQPVESNPENDFKTEGNDNHESLIPKQGESNESQEPIKAGTGTQILATVRKTGEKIFPNITDAWLNYQNSPVDKVGTEVNFEINTTDYGVTNANNAIKGYKTLLEGNTLTQKQIDFLIDNLPISVNIEGRTSPIMSKPAQGKTDAYTESTRLLRAHIVNALLNGNKIEDISTTIQFQYSGVLKVAPKTADDKVAENNIFDLDIFNGMSEKEKISYFKENIRVVNDTGKFMRLDGTTEEFTNKADETKANAKGEMYLWIPKANGKPFPLKLNMQKINDLDTSIITKIYQLRFADETIKKDSYISDINNSELNDLIDQKFKEIQDVIGQDKKVSNVFGKARKDMTIKDIVDFLVWDGTDNMNAKTRMGFVGNPSGLVLEYGSNAEQKDSFKPEEFKKWLQQVKRYSISIKPKKNETTKATFATSDEYISYILNSNKLNTNAIVGERTFQGYTDIYLDSNNVKFKGKAKEVKSLSEAIPTDNQSEIDKINNNADIKVNTNSGNITIKSDGTLFYDNGNEVIDETTKNKALVKKSQQEKTLKRINYNNSEYAILPDNRIISLNPSSAGKEVYKSGAQRDKILNESLKSVEKTKEITRNSQKEVVSLHEVPNTGTKINVDKLKQTTQKTDKLEVSKEEVNKIRKELKDNGLLIIGSESYNNIMSKKDSNTEMYKAMKNVLDKFNKEKSDSKLDCKGK